MLREPVIAYVGVGANLGDAALTVRQAIEDLSRVCGVHLATASSLYRTAPIDSSGPDYINAVAQVSTVLSAPDLMFALQRLERQAGRARPYFNAPRTLDLDLLLYGDARIDSADLTVPHPRMLQRAFVLLPLSEIAPALVLLTQLQCVAGQGIVRVD